MQAAWVLDRRGTPWETPSQPLPEATTDAALCAQSQCHVDMAAWQHPGPRWLAWGDTPPCRGARGGNLSNRCDACAPWQPTPFDRPCLPLTIPTGP